MSNDFLFDRKLLDEIKADDIVRDLSRNGSSHDRFRLRPLSCNDHGYLKLLEQLTEVGEIKESEFKDVFTHMASCSGTYFIVVLEDNLTREIIGGATLFIEAKFIHNCSKRGHIEDVVVDENYRGQNLGRMLIECLVRIGKHLGCYKLSLDCSDDKVGFYGKLGFQRKNNIMYHRFDNPGNANGRTMDKIIYPRKL